MGRTDTEEYALAFVLKKAIEQQQLDEGDIALLMYRTGMKREYVDAIPMRMLQTKNLPAKYLEPIDKTAVRAHLEAQLRDHIAEEA